MTQPTEMDQTMHTTETAAKMRDKMDRMRRTEQTTQTTVSISKDTYWLLRKKRDELVQVKKKNLTYDDVIKYLLGEVN